MPAATPPQRMRPMCAHHGDHRFHLVLCYNAYCSTDRVAAFRHFRVSIVVVIRSFVFIFSRARISLFFSTFLAHPLADIHSIARYISDKITGP
jgi:hypothetical protein